ncbi:MAG TPA: PhzF family phenazine biosynthesis protein [Ktedonobacterales bacterium]|jgi:PhzF family phenazine biosynthesis protein|nr:PhzF family phenazine biosynthesis protein [Ktedonobacterales bacterium]
MGLAIRQVDAFTNTPFGGNPAAVCILPEPADDTWMQHVAREMNLADTAFLYRQEDGFQLRWFTPAIEVDLCGHATLASAHILWEEGHLQPGELARFSTRSGLLTAVRQGAWIELDFPATPAEPAEIPGELSQALGVELAYVGKNQSDYLVEVDSEATLRALTPDVNLLARLPARGVIVTSRSASPEYDFISRFFAPKAGINEDAVTGSSHCALAPFWSQRLSKSEMTAYQASSRGGVLRVGVHGDRIAIGGQAVTVLRGELLV